MLLMQMSWDFVSTWIKYTEKFFYNPATGKIIANPFILWTSQHQHIAQAMDYVECVNLSMQTGVFFLMQCFWNYLSNSVAKKTFMGSMEFKFYIVWALCSVAVFPILQWRFREDVYMRETVPQFAYSVEILITAILGIRSHRRFMRIINISRNLKTGANAIVERLAYFRDMNAFLTIILFIYGTSLCILCVDGFTTAETINQNKFASDLLIANCNTAVVLMWLVCISIFHPRPSDDENMSSMQKSADVEHYSNNNNNDRYIQERNIYNDSDYSQFNDNNSNFMRHPMSPAAVSYPQDGERIFTPTSQFSNASTFHNNNNHVSVVEDPYNKHAVSFHMLEPTYNGKLYNMSQPSLSPNSSHFRF
ncbi:hypothetical protein K501DRAFT_327044 [Backusella circina FSU 941]|nr:hypothetical protein K501DRAFT_327044 [Backusella circina FSU 941]